MHQAPAAYLVMQFKRTNLHPQSQNRRPRKVDPEQLPQYHGQLLHRQSCHLLPCENLAFLCLWSRPIFLPLILVRRLRVVLF